MAMGGGTDGNVVGVADIYHSYFLRLFQAQVPDPGQRLELAQRLELLARTAQWCLRSYWLDGQRVQTCEDEELRELLKRAGVLIRVGGPDSQRVRFFHDSMQSYLTAYGLEQADRGGYARLPGPTGGGAPANWDRSSVLLRAAASPDFSATGADLLSTGGSELYQMCLVLFRKRPGLGQWLRDELVRWANEYDEDLRKINVVGALPPQLAAMAGNVRGAARLLREAAGLCFQVDQEHDSVEMLGRLYAGMAPVIYGLKTRAPTTKPPADISWEPILERLPEFADDIRKAQELLSVDHASALNRIRSIAEGVLQTIGTRHGIRWGKGEPNLESMRHQLVSVGAMTKRVGEYVKVIQAVCNPASHDLGSLPLTHVRIAQSALGGLLTGFLEGPVPAP
jgi:hypothetical protein